jgi:hypothetical protein
VSTLSSDGVHDLRRDAMADMTDEVPTDPADRRRAAALISHHATTDDVGARFIIEEAANANRMPQLLLAVIDHGAKLLAALRTDMGVEAASSLFDTWANQTENVDWSRAASCFIARFQFKWDIYNGHVANATADGRMSELINTTAGSILAVMPELHSPKGRATLAQITAFMSGEEPPDDAPPG